MTVTSSTLRPIVVCTNRCVHTSGFTVSTPSRMTSQQYAAMRRPLICPSKSRRKSLRCAQPRSCSWSTRPWRRAQIVKSRRRCSRSPYRYPQKAKAAARLPSESSGWTEKNCSRSCKSWDLVPTVVAVVLDRVVDDHIVELQVEHREHEIRDEIGITVLAPHLGRCRRTGDLSAGAHQLLPLRFAESCRHRNTAGLIDHLHGLPRPRQRDSNCVCRCASQIGRPGRAHRRPESPNVRT